MLLLLDFLQFFFGSLVGGGALRMSSAASSADISMARGCGQKILFQVDINLIYY
jgi:hypothetical protein